MKAARAADSGRDTPAHTCRHTYFGAPAGTPLTLCGLRVMDIDWENRTVSVNEVQMWVKGELVVKGPKTASGLRTIPLPEWLVDELRDHLDKRAAAVGRPLERTERIYASPRGKACSTTPCGASSTEHVMWPASGASAPTTSDTATRQCSSTSELTRRPSANEWATPRSA
jgi:hypothetical protein